MRWHWIVVLAITAFLVVTVMNAITPDLVNGISTVVLQTMRARAEAALHTVTEMVRRPGKSGSAMVLHSRQMTDPDPFLPHSGRRKPAGGAPARVLQALCGIVLLAGTAWGAKWVNENKLGARRKQERMAGSLARAVRRMEPAKLAES